MNKNLPPLEKRNCFSVKDSCINFILALIVPFVASLALIILFMFLAVATGNSYKEFIATEFVKVVNLIFTPIVFFFIYFIYVKKFHYNVFKASDISFKLNWVKVLIVITISVIAVFMISPFISLVNYGFSQINYNPSNELPYVMDNGWRLVVGIIAMAVLPAICEELLFRGLIFKGLEKKFNPHIAILLSALMFTLLHGSLQQTVYQFILGMILGYAMYFGKSIVYPIIVHFINNLVVVISSFIYTIKNIDVNVSPVYETAWDYIYPILLLIFALGIIAGLIFLLKYFNDIEKLKNKKDLNNETEKAEDNLNVESDKLNNKNLKNKAINKTENNIIINENEINKQQENSNENSLQIAKEEITKEEKIYVWCSFGLALFLWISNTLMQFFGL